MTSPSAQKAADRKMKRALNLVWNRHRRKGAKYTEWHAPCGCAFHPEPKPHVHPCETHSLEALDARLKAADRAAVATWKKTDSCVENKMIIEACFKEFLP